MKNYRLFENVKVFYQMPTGWEEISCAQTAPSGYVWIFNCKSIFTREYRHALLRVKN